MVLLAHAQRLGTSHGEPDGETDYGEALEHDRKVEAVVRNLDSSRKKAARRSRAQGDEPPEGEDTSWRSAAPFAGQTYENLTHCRCSCSGQVQAKG